MSQWAELGFKPTLSGPRANAFDHLAAPLTVANIPYPTWSDLQDMWRLVSSLFKVLKMPSPASGWDSANLMDINQLLALLEDVICLQNMAGQMFWEEAKQREGPLTLTLGTEQVRGRP